MLWAITGNQGQDKPHSPWLSASLFHRMVLLICAAAVHSTWKHIQRLVPDKRLDKRPRLMKLKLCMCGGTKWDDCWLYLLSNKFLSRIWFIQIQMKYFYREKLRFAQTQKQQSLLKPVKVWHTSFWLFLHHPLLVTEDTEAKSSFTITHLFILKWCILFSTRPDLSLLLLLHWSIHVLIRSFNIGQLVLWGKVWGLHSVWLLPRPEILLMGRASRHRAGVPVLNPLVACCAF